MSYRHPDTEHHHDADGRDHVHHPGTARHSLIAVDNGTISRISIPCFARGDVTPPPHDRDQHDHEGWPEPDSTDDSCQLPPCRYDQILVLNEIDLLGEGYDTIDVSLHEPPIGLVVNGAINGSSVDLTVITMCRAAETKDVDVEFSVYAIGTRTEEDESETKLRDVVTKGILHIEAGPLDDTSWWVTPSISDQINERIDGIEHYLGDGAISVNTTETGELIEKTYQVGGPGWAISHNGYYVDIVDPDFDEGVTVRVAGQVSYGTWSVEFDVSHTFNSDSEETYQETMPGENSNPNDWSTHYSGTLTIRSNGNGRFFVLYQLSHDVPPDHEIVTDPLDIANALVEINYKTKKIMVDIDINGSHVTVDNNGDIVIGDRKITIGSDGTVGLGDGTVTIDNDGTVTIGEDTVTINNDGTVTVGDNGLVIDDDGVISSEDDQWVEVPLDDWIYNNLPNPNFTFSANCVVKVNRFRKRVFCNLRIRQDVPNLGGGVEIARIRNEYAPVMDLRVQYVHTDHSSTEELRVNSDSITPALISGTDWSNLGFQWFDFEYPIA